MKRAFIIAILFALVMALPSCGSTDANRGLEASPTWQEQYDLGMRYLSEGNYTEAIIAFTAAIEIDPKQAEAYIGRGDAYVGKAGEDEAAEQDYLYAIELNAGIPTTYTKLAKIYLKQGEWDKVVEILDNGYDATGDESLRADYSEYLIGDAIEETELTIGGIPFYELSIEDAITLLPDEPMMAGDREIDPKTRLGNYTDSNGIEFQYWWNQQTAENGNSFSTITITQYAGRSTLGEVNYLGGQLDGRLDVQTEFRSIAIGDSPKDVLMKLGLSEEGAEKLSGLITKGVILVRRDEEGDTKVYHYNEISGNTIRCRIADSKVVFQFRNGALSEAYFAHNEIPLRWTT